MKIRPLTGQVLVQVLHTESKTLSGLHLLEVSDPTQKAQPFKALVIAMGPWKKTKNGYGVLPDFGIGHTVLCTPYAGQALSRDVGERYQLVRSEDVLAVIETTFPC